MALNVCMHKFVHKINVQNISQINHDSVNLVIHFWGRLHDTVFNWKRNVFSAFWPFIYTSAFENGFQSARLRFHVYVEYYAQVVWTFMICLRCCSVLLNIGLVVEWDRAVWSFFKILLWGSMKKMQCQCKRANCI